MNRRDFIKSTIVGSAALALPAVSAREKQTASIVFSSSPTATVTITGFDIFGRRVTETFHVYGGYGVSREVYQ